MNNKVMKNASICLLVTTILFVLTILFIPLFVPSDVFDTSAYYVLAIFLELIPLGLAIAMYMFISGTKLTGLIVFNPVQFRENKSKLLLQSIIAAIMALSGYVFVTFIQLLWLMLLDKLGLEINQPALPPVESITALVLATISIAIVPAFSEEIIFRGIFQKGLLRHKKPLTAIIISSALFMLMHGSLESMLYTFVLGAVMGYMAYASGSIIPTIVFHFVNNSISVVSLYLVNIFPDFFDAQAESASGLSDIGNNEILMLLVPAIVSGAALFGLLWGYRAISTIPPTNTDMKPMPKLSIAFIVIAALILIGLIFINVLASMYL